MCDSYATEAIYFKTNFKLIGIMQQETIKLDATK